MTDLKALSDAATQGEWAADFGEAFHIRDSSDGSLAMMKFLKGRGGLGGRRDNTEVAANARFICALANAYRSGLLVPATEGDG